MAAEDTNKGVVGRHWFQRKRKTKTKKRKKKKTTTTTKPEVSC